MISTILTGMIGGDKQLATDIENAIKAFEKRVEEKKDERPAEVPYKDFSVDKNIVKVIPIIDRKTRVQNIGLQVVLTNGEAQVLMYAMPITLVYVFNNKEIVTRYEIRYSRSMCQYILAECGKENDKDRHIKLSDLDQLLESKNVYAHI